MLVLVHMYNTHLAERQVIMFKSIHNKLAIILYIIIIANHYINSAQKIFYYSVLLKNETRTSTKQNAERV